ncbi:hypothetical protein RND71_044131 [Anisodus tanguticus]|uniref:Uncharacterized protein n=1 Tax=Anisodus tanguticus TaxID=243964 RepID=A0AAE1QPI9_9SOLA|nr:hypothetical protein RND71_044131 [Anisodus tanguticus]
MDEGKIKVKQLSVGSSFVCALLETGLVKAIDEEGSSVKFELEADLDEFEYVACGHEHVLLLTKKGSVYSYGMGSRGQLGHGNSEDVTEDCKLIEALEGIKIIQISAGSWHSLALSEFGDVYSWGLNESGQLGVDSTRDTSKIDL